MAFKKRTKAGVAGKTSFSRGTRKNGRARKSGAGYLQSQKYKAKTKRSGSK